MSFSGRNSKVWQMRYSELVVRILADVRIAVSFSTLLPVGLPTPGNDGDVARASWALPLAGLLVGLAGSAIYWMAWRAGLTAGPAAMLALSTTILITGAIHEDGLADTADGLGGGRTREHKLEIMRDSRIGTYGACALITSLVLRWSALAAIGKPGSVMAALMVSHAAARAALAVFMWQVGPARPDGLSAEAGRPPSRSALVAFGLGAVCLVCGFGLGKAIAAVILLSLLGLILARLAVRQVGGQTGDILGALEQVCEIAIMLMAAVLLQTERHL
jgi:adenosylcobinamide-GDP ribazoletransferase